MITLLFALAQPALAKEDHVAYGAVFVVTAGAGKVHAGGGLELAHETIEPAYNAWETAEVRSWGRAQTVSLFLTKEGPVFEALYGVGRVKPWASASFPYQTKDGALLHAGFAIAPHKRSGLVTAVSGLWGGMELRVEATSTPTGMLPRAVLGARLTPHGATLD